MITDLGTDRDLHIARRSRAPPAEPSHGPRATRGLGSGQHDVPAPRRGRRRGRLPGSGDPRSRGAEPGDGPRPRWIPPELAARAAETVLRFRTIAERSGADRLVAIGTSALRDAPNRAELDAVLGPAAGVPIRYIDGREEARLMFAGIRSSVALGPGTTLFLDLGGGSLEVALANGELRRGESVPVGAGRLTAPLMGGDPPTRSERKAVKDTVTDALEHLVEPVRREAPVRCVASGGTAGALARVLAARRWATPPDLLNGFGFALRQIRDLSRELAALTFPPRGYQVTAPWFAWPTTLPYFASAPCV